MAVGIRLATKTFMRSNTDGFVIDKTLFLYRDASSPHGVESRVNFGVTVWGERRSTFGCDGQGCTNFCRKDEDGMTAY